MVTTTKPVNIGKFISRTPEVWHGLPVITGTRITVMGIISLHLIDGLSADEIPRGKELTLSPSFYRP